MAAFTLTTYIYVLSVVLMTNTVAGFYSFNNSHICCDGVVWEWNISGSMSCCGTELHDSTAMCCGSTLFRDVQEDDTTNYQCCEDKVTKAMKLYDSYKEVCCDKGIIPKPSHGEEYDCCGEELISFRDVSTTCCNDKIVSNCSETEFCCGNKEMYDSKKSLCGALYSPKGKLLSHVLKPIENNHTWLCKDVLYDSYTHECCFDEIVLKEKSLQGDRSVMCVKFDSKVLMFDYTTHVFCESTGEFLDIPVAYQDEGVSVECCAGVLFNTSSQACCNGVLHERIEEFEGQCCGYELLTNLTTHLCCNEIIEQQSEDLSLTCCDNKVINSTNHETRCCYSGEKEEIYDSAKSGCCENGVEARDPDDVKARNADQLCREAY